MYESRKVELDLDNMFGLHLKSYIYIYKLTATTESRAATARISAHDTVCLQTLSTCVLILSITSNPLNEF